jgi:TolB-like protein
MRFSVCGFFCVALTCLVVPTALGQASPDVGIKYLSDQISNQISKGVTQKGKTKIAVVAFSDVNGSVSGLGLFLADELTSHLFKTGKFTVVERQQVKKLEEDDRRFRASAIGDPAAASKLLTILDVNALVSGTITDRGDSVHVNARLFGKDGRVFAAASADIVKDDSVIRLMGQSPPPSVGPPSWESSLEHFEIGSRKMGNIMEGQHRDYVFDGTGNSPLIFTIRADQCVGGIERFKAGIFDTKGQVLREPIFIWHDRVQELRFTPQSDDRYVIRIAGEHGRCRYTVYLETPK